MEILNQNSLNEELIRTLRCIPTLQYFGNEDFNRIVRASKLAKYSRGEEIVKEGEFDNRMFFLVSGCVHVLKNGIPIKTLDRTGDIFGEMGVIQGESRSASVIAEEETLCLLTDVSFMDNLKDEDKIAFCAVFYMMAAVVLAQRLRETSEELTRLKKGS